MLFLSLAESNLKFTCFKQKQLCENLEQFIFMYVNIIFQKKTHFEDQIFCHLFIFTFSYMRFFYN